MTRIIVIGNSHVAALKVAWDAFASDHPGIEVDFFAAGGRSFRRFRLLEGLDFGLPVAARKNGAALDASGRSCINLGWADYVIWAGYHWQLRAVAGLMRDFDIDGLRDVGAPQMLSRAAFDAFSAQIAAEIAPLPEWRNWTRPQLILVPAPVRSANCLTKSSRMNFFSFLARNPAGGREVIGAFMDVFANTLRADGIELVAQPSETLQPSGFSDPRYSRGGITFTNLTGKPQDLSHMNAEYGKLILSAVLTRLVLAEQPPTLAAAL